MMNDEAARCRLMASPPPPSSASKRAAAITASSSAAADLHGVPLPFGLGEFLVDLPAGVGSGSTSEAIAGIGAGAPFTSTAAVNEGPLGVADPNLISNEGDGVIVDARHGSHAEAALLPSVAALARPRTVAAAPPLLSSAAHVDPSGAKARVGGVGVAKDVSDVLLGASWAAAVLQQQQPQQRDDFAPVGDQEDEPSSPLAVKHLEPSPLAAGMASPGRDRFASARIPQSPGVRAAARVTKSAVQSSRSRRASAPEVALPRLHCESPAVIPRGRGPTARRRTHSIAAAAEEVAGSGAALEALQWDQQGVVRAAAVPRRRGARVVRSRALTMECDDGEDDVALEDSEPASPVALPVRALRTRRAFVARRCVAEDTGTEEEEEDVSDGPGGDDSEDEVSSGDESKESDWGSDVSESGPRRQREQKSRASMAASASHAATEAQKAAVRKRKASAGVEGEARAGPAAAGASQAKRRRCVCRFNLHAPQSQRYLYLDSDPC